MKGVPKAYFKGIERKLIELINSSKMEIKIAMAWFTNNDIKDCLIKKKESNSDLEVIIVIDENHVNDKYFTNYESKFSTVGIQVKKKTSNRFLHNKFMIIDELITVTGSYNYSKRANNNLENIVVIEDPNFSFYYSRVFNFLTKSNYVDENIMILFENPRFAQVLLSTYYAFNRIEYRKYKDKIETGDCFTHENGMYDEITYYPGFIFNPKIASYNPNITEFSEFNIPVSKDIIKAWVEGRNMNLILDSFNGEEESYHLINGELEKNEQAVENYFKRKLENTYQYTQLKKMVENGVDIILEDDLWINNFEPFINERLVEKIFDKIEIIEEKSLF